MSTVSVASLGRDVNGSLTYDVTESVPGVAAEGGVCYQDHWCTGSVQTEFTDGTTGWLASGADLLSSSTHQFIGSLSSAKIIAVRAIATSFYGTFTGDWAPVADNYPTPVVNVTDASASRDSTGNLVYDVNISGSYLGIPGAICYAASWCTGGVQVQYASDGSVGLLASGADFNGTAPVSHEFTGSASSRAITAVRAYVYTYSNTFTGDWEPVTDAIPAPTVTLDVGAIGRDSSGNLSYDVVEHGSYLNAYGGICYNQNWCTGGVQVKYANDGSPGALDGGADFMGGAPVSHEFTGLVYSKQITAIRPYVYNYATTIYGAWVPAEDTLPTPRATVTVEVLNRGSNGSLVYDVTERGKYLGVPGGICAGALWCTGGVQVMRASDFSIGWLDSGADFSGLAPVVHHFTGTISTQSIVAVRTVVYSYAGYNYGDWVPVSENVQGGHDLTGALALINAEIASSAVPCITLFPVGTHLEGGSVNDQQLDCEAAVEGQGQSFGQYIGAYLKTLTPKQVAQLLVTAGLASSAAIAIVSPMLDYGKPLPVGCVWTGLEAISCTTNGTTTVHTPISAAPKQDPLFQHNQQSKAQQNNPGPVIPPVPAPGATPAPTDNAVSDDYRAAALDQCDTEVLAFGEADGLTLDDCDSMPIFFTGTDVQDATNHDFDAIADNPALMQLSYVKSAEKAGVTRPIWGSYPACAGQTGGTTGKQCDEYPFFSTEEGYPTATPDLRPIDATQNMSQGGSLTAFYNGCPTLQIAARGTAQRRYLVVPWFLPTMSFCPVG